MTVVMIRQGPVDPTMTMGIPEKREKNTPIQEVAKMVSTAPIWLSVFSPYTAPKVNVGAMTVMNMSKLTATVFWLKLVISDTQ